MPVQETLHYFFPVVLQASEVENPTEFNEALIAEIAGVRQSVPNTRPGNWSCDLYTTIGRTTAMDLSARPALAALNEIVLGEALKYARSLGLAVDSYPLQLTDFWLNVYGRDHAQEVHTHGLSVISGIYYVKTPPGCGDTLFHAPMGDQMLAPPRSEINPLNTSFTRWTPQAGQLVLFRGWLKHSVQANTVDDDRITIAFNLNM
jgi:uncharacterized protein (TIGR02466 family)